MPSYTVVLADAQYLSRLGFKHLIADMEEFQVVEEVSTESALVNSLQNTPPNIVVLDYKQENRFSIHTVNKIKQLSPKTNILVISFDSDKKSIYEIVNSDICSYLSKECGEEEIVNAVKATAKGEKFFCSKILNYILDKSFHQEVTKSDIPLSDRQIEIVRLIAEGKIAKEIADELNLSTHTVYTHRKNIMRKLSLRSASDLVMYAINNGITTNQNP